jgi:hypothetical protein
VNVALSHIVRIIQINAAIECVTNYKFNKYVSKFNEFNSDCVNNIDL